MSVENQDSPFGVLSTMSGSSDPTAPAILLVEPNLDDLVTTATFLTVAGFRVTAVETFNKARAILGSHSPAILLTELRLGSYNGLHLVVRGKALQPSLAAIVTSHAADAAAQAEAELLGATFLIRPVAPNELVALILKTYYRAGDDAAPIRPPYERRTGERRAGLQPVPSDRRQTDRRRTLPWLVVPTHPTIGS